MQKWYQTSQIRPPTRHSTCVCVTQGRGLQHGSCDQDRPHRNFSTNALSFRLIYWTVAVSPIIQPMKLLFPLVAVSLFVIIVFQMSEIFKCGVPCNRSFFSSRGLSHHRRSCQVYIRRRMEIFDTRIELNRSNRILERPTKRARVSYANNLVRPLDLSRFV